MLKSNEILASLPAQQLNMDEHNKVIVCERNNLIFAFNFHGEHSIFDYKFKVPKKGKYKIILSTDDHAFGGFGRVDANLDHHTIDGDQLSIYLPARTALALKMV